MGTFAVKNGQQASLVERYNGVAIPKVRKCAGNVACLLLEPQEPGADFVAVTVWNTRADAEAYDSSGTASEVVALVREFFAGPPTLRNFESNSLAGLPLGRK
jgi:heme-degrading monooxygenase HmoA